MKKLLFILLLTTLTTFIFAACDGLRGTIDHRSIRCTETNIILSLGDPKSAFDDALGAGQCESVIALEGRGFYSYALGALEVTFLNDIAVSMTVLSNRFEFRDMYFDMTLDDIRRRFETQNEGYVYAQLYNARGNPSSFANAKYMASIFLRDGKVISLSIICVSIV